MPVIIDGYNLLRSIQNIEESTFISDIGLCRILDSYFGLAGDKAEIIFDGIGPPNKSEFSNIKNIEISFSGRTSDCDTIIEHRIQDSTAPKRLTIVSSDRRLRDAARRRKAASVKSEDFWEMMKKQLSRRRPGKEPAAKRSGLTESETELWLETFGLDRQRPRTKQ